MLNTREEFFFKWHFALTSVFPALSGLQPVCAVICPPLSLLQPAQWSNVPLSRMHWRGLLWSFHCINIPPLGAHAQLLAVATACTSGRASMQELVMVPASHPPSSQMYMQRCSTMWCHNMIEKCMVPMC